MADVLDLEWFDIERDPPGWDALAAKTGQNLFHRAAVLATEQWGRSVRRGIVLRRDGIAIGAIGGLVNPVGNGGMFRTLSFLRASDAQTREIPRKLVDWLLSQGMTAIALGSFDGGVEGYETGGFNGATERLEFIYDLSVPEELRLRMANNNHRRKLRRAEQEPMILRRIDRYQAWVMARLHLSWASRRGERFNPVAFVKTYRYYRHLNGALAADRSASLYGIFDMQDRILSMAYMLESTSSSFYMIGASSDEGYKRGASVKLFFELAKRYQRQGISQMNFGGVPAAASDEKHGEFGVFRFKSGFGITPILRRSLTIEA